MDKMISKMRNEMKQAMAEPMDMRGMGGNGMAQGRFASMQQMTSMKADQHGNPVKETYQTSA